MTHSPEELRARLREIKKKVEVSKSIAEATDNLPASFVMIYPEQLDFLITHLEAALSEIESLKEEINSQRKHYERTRSLRNQEIEQLRAKYEGLGKDYESLYSQHTNLLNDGVDLYLKKQNNKLAKEYARLLAEYREFEAKAEKIALAAAVVLSGHFRAAPVPLDVEVLMDVLAEYRGEKK